MRILFIVISLVFLACPYVPPPTPVAMKPRTVKDFNFCGFRTSTIQAQAIPVELIVPKSTGNQASILGDVITLKSSVGKFSGYVVSANKFKSDGLIVQNKIVQAAWDYDLILSPTRNLNSVDGLYSEPTWVKITGYRNNPRQLHAHTKSVTSPIKEWFLRNTAEPFWWGLETKKDSVFWKYSTDGTNWQTVHKLPYTMPDSVYIGLRAHETVTGGFVIASGLTVSYKAVEPPKPPVGLAYNYGTVSWNANTEPDLAGYKVWYGKSSRMYDKSIDAGLKTEQYVSGLDWNAVYYFTVTAYDTAGNHSAYSSEVIAETGEQPADTSLVTIPNSAESLIFCIVPDWTDSAGVKFDSLSFQIFGSREMVYEKTHFGASELLVLVPADTASYRVRQVNPRLNLPGDWTNLDKKFKKE